jgi:hypothetical protein
MHDPDLGWPSPLRGADEGRDAVGARHSPAFPDREATQPLVALYGDSFTWSDGVDDAQAWPEVLATLLGARVDNFGVAAYGSDQALLRFRQKSRAGVDSAPIAILAHLSENVVRNLNQFRGLLAPGSAGLGFKPRFVLEDDGRLALVPLPLPTPDRYVAAVRNPGSWLAHETFLPGSPEGPRLARFPFSLSLAAAVTHPRLRAFAAREPHYEHFYDRDHPGQGTALTATILETFGREASSAGRLPLVILLPTGRDLELHARTGRWSYQPLADALATRGVPALDLGPVLATRAAGTPLADLFAGGDVGGHFGETGYRLVAEAVHEHLASSGLLARARAMTRMR